MPIENGASRMRWRVTVLVAAGAVAVGVVMSTVSAYSRFSSAREELVRRARAQMEHLGGVLEEPLRAGDEAALARLAEVAVGDPQILEVTVTGGDGRVLASAGRAGVRGPAPAAYRSPGDGIRVHPAETAHTGEHEILLVAPVAGRAGPAVEPGRADATVALRVSTAGLPGASKWAVWVDLAKAGVAIAALVVLVYWLLGWVLRPVTTVQDAIDALARGDVEARVEAGRLGPLSAVGRAANRLGETYTHVARQVVAMAERVRALVERLGEAASEAEAGADAQRGGFERATSLIGEIEESVSRIQREVRILSDSTEESSSAVVATQSAADEIARNMDVLQESVESASSASREMGGAIRLVAGSSDEVQHMAHDTASAMTQMDRAIQEVGEHVREASELTERVSAGAEEGSRAVAVTIDGIADIRERTLGARSVFERLDGRIAEIGEILDVMGSINDETNLLSLNAAIIAAQAGEHGRAFSVVADQVRTLAERTGRSARQIGSIVHAVKSESKNVMGALEAGVGAVETGVARSRRAGEALEMIRLSSGEASTRVSEIARATAEQQRNSRHVAEAASRTSAMVEQISAAVAQQSRAGERLLETSDASLEVCAKVHRAADRQREMGGTLTDRITAIATTMRFVQEGLDSHGRSTAAVGATIEQILESGQKSLTPISTLTDTVDALRADADALRRLLGHFRSASADA